jgi:hypothetical protein
MTNRLMPLILLAAFFSASKADADAWIGNTWILHKRSASQCADAAQNVLASLGYKISFSTSFATFGETNERTILVYCQIPHYAIIELSASDTIPDSDVKTLKSYLEQALKSR